MVTDGSATMFDVLHFEGPLARFTLRHWHGGGDVETRGTRVRFDDEHQALSLLRGAVDTRALHQLRVFMFEYVGREPPGDPGVLLAQVAGCLVREELVIVREAPAIMASEDVEFADRQPHYDAPVNVIEEGVGLHTLWILESEQLRQQTQLDCQAKQAQTLVEASEQGTPFCEVCAGAHSSKARSEPTPEELATQARQAEALVEASESGAAFCEVCAACLESQLPQPLVSPPSELGTQAKQAEALVEASESGAAFCEVCASCMDPTIKGESLSPPEPSLGTQANQAKTLQTASKSGVGFCEQCTC